MAGTQGRGSNNGDVRRYPIILHSSLAEGPLYKILQEHESLKPRVSTAVLPRTCILPSSSLAMMIIGVDDIYISKSSVSPLSQESVEAIELNSTILSKLKEFRQRHCNCYVLLCGNDISPLRQSAIGTLQKRVLHLDMTLVILNNAKDVMQFISSIIKVRKPDVYAMVQQHHKRQMEQHANMTLERVAGLLEVIGVRSHDAIVLYDTFGNLANIAGTSHEQLMECCIPQAVADAIHDFFSSDCVPL